MASQIVMGRINLARRTLADRAPAADLDVPDPAEGPSPLPADRDRTMAYFLSARRGISKVQMVMVLGLITVLGLVTYGFMSRPDPTLTERPLTTEVTNGPF